MLVLAQSRSYLALHEGISDQNTFKTANSELPYCSPSVLKFAKVEKNSFKLLQVVLFPKSIKMQEELKADVFRSFLNRCPDILPFIISYSALPELVAIASVNRHLRWLVQHDLRLRFADLMRPFVSNITEAARVLRRTRTAISGSQVLQFMDPSNAPWKDTVKDLDLYTTEEGFLILLAFWVDSEGYTVHDSNHPSLQKPVDEDADDEMDVEQQASGTFNGFNLEGISSVTQLRKGDQRVDIIVSNSPFCSTFPIFFFHSTVVMNFLTPDSVFCTYPKLTFKKRGLTHRINYRLNERTIAAFQKYKDRGYTVSLTPNGWDELHLLTCPTGFCRGVRTTIDKMNLYFPFDSVTGHDDSVAFDYYRNILGGRVKWCLGGKKCVPTNLNEIYAHNIEYLNFAQVF